MRYEISHTYCAICRMCGVAATVEGLVIFSRRVLSARRKKIKRTSSIKIPEVAGMREGQGEKESDYIKAYYLAQGKDPIDILVFAHDICKRANRMYMFKCPNCGGTAQAVKSGVNGHVRAMCVDCGIRVIE